MVLMGPAPGRVFQVGGTAGQTAVRLDGEEPGEQSGCQPQQGPKQGMTGLCAPVWLLWGPRLARGGKTRGQVGDPKIRHHPGNLPVATIHLLAGRLIEANS